MLTTVGVVILIKMVIVKASIPLDETKGSFCTAENLCSKGIEKYPYIYTDICLPCSCYGDCTEETYCPAHSLEEAKCVHQTSFLNMTDMIPILHPTLKRKFYVIATCPPDTTSEEKIQCESIQTLNNSHYVSGINSFKIYKNEICAKCNGEHEYVRWKYTAVLTNEDIAEIENSTKSDVEILAEIKKRGVLSTPPDDYPEHINTCNDDDVTECNVTGWWQSYDKNLDHLCSYPLYASIEAWRTVYKNVYCAACNVFADECIHPGKKPDNTGGFGIFSGLLSWIEKETPERETERPHRCSDNQIIDPLERFCQPIICPMGQFAINGYCKKRSFSLWNMAVGVHVSAYFQNETIYENFHEQMIKEKIPEECDWCDFNCKKLYNEYGIVESCVIWFKTTDLCNLDFLVEFLSPTNAAFNIDNDKISVNFNIEFTKEATSSYVDVVKCQTRSTLHLVPKFYCPAIVVSPTSIQKITEYGLVDIFNDLSEELLDDDINQTSSLGYNSCRIICISDYLDLASMVSGCTSIYSINTSYIILYIFVRMTLDACW